MLKPVKFLAAVILPLFSASVFAIPSNTLTGNGVVWTLNVDSINANVASFSLFADVSGSTLGDAYLHEFSLKNFGSNASLTNLNAPAGDWEWENEILAGQGCQDNGTYDALCVYNTEYFKNAPSTDSDFMFNFDISLDVEDLFPELLHFKVRWVAEAEHGHGHKHRGPYVKVGDLISDSFSIAPGPGPDPRPVPEPGILGLIILGLFAMFAIYRMKTHTR